MAYIVLKTIKGRRYRYQQRSYRVDGKVRTETTYLGPEDGGRPRKTLLRKIGDLIDANLKHEHGFLDEEAALRQYNERIERDRLARDATLAKLHALYGLRLSLDQPVPQPQMETPSEEGANTISTQTPASM